MPGFGPDPSSLFSVFFVVALGIIIFGIVSNIVEWSRNQASEVRMRNVRVVAKRNHVHRTGGTTHIHHHSTGSGVHHSHPIPSSGSAYTTYYVTFEFLDDGSRLELRVPDKQYGLIAEGDYGILNYQGTQFNAFERTRNPEIYRT
ncbi:MAG: DUF2500 domain-containing protein [Firmicutes bacterium]|nr:DUF2500 domain-containing protein [Bacillota bacterium]